MKHILEIEINKLNKHFVKFKFFKFDYLFITMIKTISYAFSFDLKSKYGFTIMSIDCPQNNIERNKTLYVCGKHYWENTKIIEIELKHYKAMLEIFKELTCNYCLAKYNFTFNETKKKFIIEIEVENG